MYRNKFVALLLIFALCIPMLGMPVKQAGANNNLEQIWQNASRYNDNKIDIVELSDLEDIKYNEIIVRSGELRIPYADIIGKHNVASSVYYTEEVTGAVYGEIGINLPDIILGDGNFNLITNINGKLTAKKVDKTISVSLIADKTKPHHYKNNPLQKISISWATKYGWTKLDIIPISTADLTFSGRLISEDLLLSPIMYNSKTDELYSDIAKQKGTIIMADGTTLKSKSTDLLVQKNEVITINYADSLATVQDSTYSEYGVIILHPEKLGELEQVIIKQEDKEAYFIQPRYGGIPVPLLINEKIPYNIKNNPTYQNIELAWKKANDGNWKMVTIKLVSKTDDFFKRAETYTGNLELHNSLYNKDTKIIYSNADQKTGELKAKDGTTITKDNLISQSGGLIRVNYADTFVTVQQKVYGENTTGYLLLKLPENIAQEDPRFIIKAGDLPPELTKVNSDFLAIPLLDSKKNLQDIVIAWRSKEGNWLKVTIKPVKEYKKPTVISLHPMGEIVDEKAFSPEVINGKERYFLRIVFADDGGLTYDNLLVSKLHTVDVFAVGGSRQSMIDNDLLEYVLKLTNEERIKFIEKYLYKKGTGNATLYIPVRKLLAQASYNVEVPSGLVHYPEGIGNDLISWSFGTIGAPHVSNISLGSIGEDYDVREPISIYGDYFAGDSIEVKFNNIYAYRVNVKKEGNKSYLEVYLPRGRDRLKPGIYNVTVIKNNNEIYSQTLHGSFSVIKTATMPTPEDGVKVKNEHRVGDVVASVKTSSDTLVLNSRYDRDYIDLNLDEIMGEHVLVRKIKFPNNWRNTTWLYTTSKWANVTVYKLRPSPDAYNIDDVELRLGRAEPSLVPTLKRSMINTTVLSEFIEISGENIEFEQLEVEIPYLNSDGQYIRVLRYDETYRQWFEQPFIKDLLNAKVRFTSNNSGVFVVVE